MSKVVGDYVLTKKLGAGSFATVYKAHHKDRPTEFVAIKSISRSKLNKKLQENLESEITILERINHPNIVRLLGIQKTERHIYLVMEYCNGGDLHKFIRRYKMLPIHIVRHLMKDLSAGLGFLNANNLIHRDLKPQNLLLSTVQLRGVDRKGNPKTSVTLKIADFGFARHLAEAMMAETLCGSPLYMAPEILRYQKYDSKADLWSVGTILFEMLVGRPPYHGGNPIELLRNIEKKPVLIPPTVRIPADCVELMLRLLKRDPAERIDYDDFLRHSFLGNPPPNDGRNTRPGSGLPPTRRSVKDSQRDGAGTPPPTATNKLPPGGMPGKRPDTAEETWEMVVPEDDDFEDVNVDKAAVPLRQPTEPVPGATEQQVSAMTASTSSGAVVPNHVVSSRMAEEMKTASSIALAYAASVGDRACKLVELARKFINKSIFQQIDLQNSSRFLSLHDSKDLDEQAKVMGLALLVKGCRILRVAIMAADDAVDASMPSGGVPNIAACTVASNLRDRCISFVMYAKNLVRRLVSQTSTDLHASPPAEKIMYEVAIQYAKKATQEEATLGLSSSRAPSPSLGQTPSTVVVSSKSMEHMTTVKKCIKYYKHSLTLFELLCLDTQQQPEDARVVGGFIAVVTQRLEKIRKTAAG